MLLYLANDNNSYIVEVYDYIKRQNELIYLASLAYYYDYFLSKNINIDLQSLLNNDEKKEILM